MIFVYLRGMTTTTSRTIRVAPKPVPQPSSRPSPVKPQVRFSPEQFSAKLLANPKFYSNATKHLAMPVYALNSGGEIDRTRTYRIKLFDAQGVTVETFQTATKKKIGSVTLDKKQIASLRKAVASGFTPEAGQETRSKAAILNSFDFVINDRG